MIFLVLYLTLRLMICKRKMN